MSLLSGRIREVGIISIILIIGISNILLFYLQNITERDLRDSLFEQQKQRQLDSTKEISQHIGSDLSLVMSMLDGLENSIYLQQGELGVDKTRKLVQEKYNKFNSIIDRLFILNKDDIMTLSLAPMGSDTFLGVDFSFRDWVKETKITLSPVFSNGYERYGAYRVFITIPIINRDTGKYIGIVGTSILTEEFFARYGNVNDINSQFLVALDRNATLLAAGINETFVGQNFFDNYVQQFVNHNKILNNFTHSLLAGNPGYAVYDYGKGERITTGYPILVNDKPTYFLQAIMPTTHIYSMVEDVLSIQRIKMFSVFTATSTAAIVVLIVLLRRWNIILRKEVKKRTRELEESYDDMKQYLESVLEEMKRKR
jgi:hypothetical protein